MASTILHPRRRVGRATSRDILDRVARLAQRGRVVSHTLGERVRGYRFIRGMAWLFAIQCAVLLPACGGKSHTATPHPQLPLLGTESAVAAVEVIPNVLFVAPPGAGTTTFELEARLRDTLGRIVPPTRGSLLEWTMSSSLTASFFEQSGHRVKLELGLGSATVPMDATVSAAVGAVIAAPNAALKVIPADVGIDRLIANHAAGSAPAVALVDGVPRNAGSCVRDSLVAFVGIGLVGDWGSNCPTDGHLAVFSPDHAMLLRLTSWNGNPNDVDVVGQQAPPLTIPVAIRIAVERIAGEELTPEQVLATTTAFALADVAKANELLRANRAGLRIEVPVGFFDTVAPGPNCSSAPMRQGVLNVFYVNDAQRGRGFTCARDGQRHEGTILISRFEHDQATLAHEFGHALGLWFPFTGHTLHVIGFDGVNVMASLLYDNSSAERSHFSLGQVFRMNADEASWVNIAGVRDTTTEIRLPCQCKRGEQQPCPRVTDDLGTPPTAGDLIPGPWECGDVLVLNQTGSSHHGVALISGRNARTKACDPDLPGLPYRQFDAKLRIYFDNLTNPDLSPKCVSRAVLFFENHGVMVKDLHAPNTFTEVADSYAVIETPPARKSVTVNLWTTASQTDDDRAFASKVFSEGSGNESNRTGIVLSFQTPPAKGGWTEDELVNGLIVSPCTLPPAFEDSTVKEINVYYIQADAKLGSDYGVTCQRPDGTVLIAIPAGTLHTKTALVHHLGHAFGLEDVGLTGGWSPSNAMRTEWSDGRKLFTLGQVYQMNFGGASVVTRTGAQSVRPCDALDPCPDGQRDVRTPP